MIQQPTPSSISICAAAFLFTSVSSHAASVMYSDGDFAGAWRTDTFSNEVAADVTQTIDTAPASSTMPSGDFIGVDVQTGPLGLNTEGFTFDPVMQINPLYTTLGIGNIEFAADVYADSNVTFLFAIEQGGTHYFGIPQTDNRRLGTAWGNRTGTLGEDEFWRFNDTLGGGGQHPDFSTAGAPITVGVYTQLGSSALQTLTGAASFDNFSATINYAVVPEPGTFGLIGISGLLYILRRRRAMPLKS